MEDIKLRLVYYFWLPDNGFNEMYDLHFKCLEKFSNIFNESIFFIAVDDINNKETLKVAADIENKLINIGFFKNVTFNIIENNKTLREAKVFKEEISDKLINLDGLTFFAHTKGISTYNVNVENNKAWVAAMYYFNLKFIEEVKYYLCQCMFNSYGFFRCFDKEFDHIKNRWMYCGSFMWLNCQKIHHYINSQNITVPELYDRGFAEDFVGNVTLWTCSASKGNWLTQKQDMYNKCIELLNVFTTSEEDLIEFKKFLKEVS